MTCGRMVKAYCFAQTTLAASSSTVRWSSVVDAAIEPTCASDTHEARATVSAISTVSHQQRPAGPLVPRWCRNPVRDAWGREAESSICNAHDPHTHTTTQPL